MEEEAKNIAWITISDTLARVNLGIVVSLSILLAIATSFLFGILVLASYILGLALFFFLFKQRDALGNVLHIFIGETTTTTDDKSHKATSCHVCGDGSCNRSRDPCLQGVPPEDILINTELDKSIENLLNRILKDFVESWYSQISTDTAFELELRLCLRRACTVVLQRGLKINLAEIIFQKLLPAGVRHLEDYLIIREMSKNQRIPFVRAAVQHLGTRLHPATLNRERELEYLRQLTECIMPSLVISSQLHCQNYNALIRELLAGWVLLPLADVLADPSILNSLLLLLLGHQQLTQYKDINEPQVKFLEKFVDLSPKHSSALHPDLSSILKDRNLLYAFMQFLKGERAVHMLQFYLDVEEFNRKMLTPDISAEEKEVLYKDAMDLFSVYFNPSSPDSIGLSPDIVESMKQVLTEDVGKLRTSPPLFEAFEHAYSILENKYCPLFHASDAFFRWLSGPRVAVAGVRSGTSSPLSQGSPAKSRSNRKANENVGAVARISSRLHKIKGVLRGPVEGHTFDSDPGIELTDPEYAEEMQLTESSDRDLSAWRVSIPAVKTKLDASNKSYSVFYINVQKIDDMKEDEFDGYHWTVERRYTDFYALEAKLTEFHGEFPDQLPPRRMLLFSAPSAQFLESRKQVFEGYIQKLLSKPSLRGSDLLYAFLRVPGEFSEMNASPDALSRLLRRTVPLTLRKERGQHLEPFLNIFFTSTEGKKTSKLEYKDVSLESPPARDFRNIIGPIFHNNFNLTEEPAPSLGNASKSSVSYSSPSLPNNRLKGFTNSLIHIGVVVYNMSCATLRIALSLQSLMGHTLDAVVSYFVGHALKTLLVAPRLAHLINLLQGAIFNSRGTHWNSMEIEERACRELDQFCAKFWLAKMAAPAFKGAFCAVQCPQLNKQLLYTLLDSIVEELFPEVCHCC